MILWLQRHTLKPVCCAVWAFGSVAKELLMTGRSGNHTNTCLVRQASTVLASLFVTCARARLGCDTAHQNASSSIAALRAMLTLATVLTLPYTTGIQPSGSRGCQHYQHNGGSLPPARPPLQSLCGAAAGDACSRARHIDRRPTATEQDSRTSSADISWWPVWPASGSTALGAQSCSQDKTSSSS